MVPSVAAVGQLGDGPVCERAHSDLPRRVDAYDSRLRRDMRRAAQLGDQVSHRGGRHRATPSRGRRDVSILGVGTVAACAAIGLAAVLTTDEPVGRGGESSRWWSTSFTTRVVLAPPSEMTSSTTAVDVTTPPSTTATTTQRRTTPTTTTAGPASPTATAGDTPTCRGKPPNHVKRPSCE